MESGEKLTSKIEIIMQILTILLWSPAKQIFGKSENIK